MGLYTSTKAQTWGVDLLVATMIFTIGIVIFYVYALNSPNEVQETINSLSKDGKFIADSLLSPGYPKDWNGLNVINIGITDNNKINETKLEQFYNLALIDYSKTKFLFNTRYNYYFFLNTPMIINGLEVNGIGKPGANPTDINSKNLIKITRLANYKNNPVTLYIYIWEE